MKKILFSSCCVLALCVSFSPSKAETLRDAVLQALAEHPTIEAAEKIRDAATQTKREQRAGYFPEINASASGGRVYGDNSTSRGLTVTRGAAYSGFGEASASITQPLFDGFETSNRVKAADARLKSENFNIADVREGLAFQAAQSYWEVFHAQRLLNKFIQFQKDIESYSNRIVLMVDEGAADDSESAQAENILLSLQNNIIDQEGLVQAALANYRQIMGTMPRSALHEPLSIHHLMPSTIDRAIDVAKSDHPLLQSLDMDRQASVFDEKAEKSLLYPAIDAELSALKRDQREEIGGEVEDGRALLVMNWSFNTGGAQFARMDRAKAEQSELVARRQEQIRQIEGDIRRGFAEKQTAAKQLAVIEERKKVTSDLLESYKTQFEGGRVRLLQLMQSENQVFNVEVERLNADYRYKLAEYAVLAAMGKLTSHLNDIPNQQFALNTQSNIAEKIEIEPSNVVLKTQQKSLVVKNTTPAEDVYKSEPIIESKDQMQSYIDPEPVQKISQKPVSTSPIMMERPVYPTKISRVLPVKQEPVMLKPLEAPKPVTPSVNKAVMDERVIFDVSGQ